MAFSARLNFATQATIADPETISIADAGGYFSTDNVEAALQSTGAQLAQIMQLGQASLYGVEPSLASDMTATLNTYFDTLKANGVKYANFDKVGQYRVDGILDSAKDLILFGAAEFEKKTFDNYYINIADTIKGVQGKINSFNFNNDQFQQFKIALSENRNIKVCFFTDSMGSGSDVLNIKYDSGGLGVSEASPNGLTAGDSYYYQFIDTITSAFPENTFDFYNRGVGGSLLGEWNDNKTFDAVTKAWIEHVKDTSADLLIVGFGMNHSYYSVSTQTAYNVKAVTDYINANFTTIPDLVWVTSPRPVLSKDGTYGDNIRQFSVDNSAQAIRSYAKEIGGYIVDVGKISNIKRTGKSYINPMYKSFATTESEVDLIATGTYTKVSPNYVLDALNEYIGFINFIVKDFIVEFDATFTDYVSSNDSLAITYNDLDNGSTNNRIYILPKSSTNGGNGQVKSYAEFVDNRWGGGFASYASSSPYASISVKIEKREDVLDIYIDDVRVIRDSVFALNQAGNIRIINSNIAGSVGIISLANIKLYKGEYKSCLPELTETDMWGTYTTAADTGTKLPTGGNGLNHPSNIALSECYAQAIKECVDDALRATGFSFNGSNANGKYVKFPDGTVIFHHQISVAASGQTHFPITSQAMPTTITGCVLQVTGYNTQDTYNANGSSETSGFATSTTAYRCSVKFPVAVTGTVVINITGIGRWK